MGLKAFPENNVVKVSCKVDGKHFLVTICRTFKHICVYMAQRHYRIYHGGIDLKVCDDDDDGDTDGFTG